MPGGVRDSISWAGSAGLVEEVNALNAGLPLSPEVMCLVLAFQDLELLSGKYSGGRFRMSQTKCGYPQDGCTGLHDFRNLRLHV